MHHNRVKMIIGRETEKQVRGIGKLYFSGNLKLFQNKMLFKQQQKWQQTKQGEVLTSKCPCREEECEQWSS